MGQRSAPAPFLTKTYKLVDDAETDDVVSWNEAGTTFVVWKTAEFAKDLLPLYFKHNNFSSFVRQLNTYGFRKTVPDQWEFANENFQRGQEELLLQIRRRRNASTSAEPAATDNITSPANSGEDLGSSSTSSRGSKNPSSTQTQASAQINDLSGENEKLREDNQMLSSELAETKRQCGDLIAFLTRCVKVAPDRISRIMNLGAEASDADAAGEVAGDGNCDFIRDDGENDNCVKLFGVMLKKKRGRGENTDISGAHEKEMKRSSDVRFPWMKSKGL
ncbi:hypothetical protein OROHE_002421 [Orobanche hederae]